MCSAKIFSGFLGIWMGSFPSLFTQSFRHDFIICGTSHIWALKKYIEAKCFPNDFLACFDKHNAAFKGQ